MTNPFHSKVSETISEDKAIKLGYIQEGKADFEQDNPDIIDFNEDAYYIQVNNRLIKVRRKQNTDKNDTEN